MSRSAARMILASLLAVTMLSGYGFADEQAGLRVYVGTYTNGASRGIYLLRFDPSSGKWMGDATLAAATENPSFLALHGSGRFLYAVNELGTFEGKKTGAVSAFAIDAATGRLTLLNKQPSEGADPCHLIVDSAGKNLLVANYTGGTVAVLPISGDGRLKAATAVDHHAGSGPVRDRQEGPHAHEILLDPAERFALSVDLGADRVFINQFDAAAGRLNAHNPASAIMPPGSGPRHLAWHPSGRALYVIHELSSSVSALRYDPERGALQLLQTINARAAGASGENSGAEIAVSHDGRFVYASNRGDDNIAVFAVGAADFKLTPVGHVPTGGHEPRHFTLDPSGRWLIAANQKSNSLVVFRIDQSTGLPSPAGSSISIAEPVCVLFAQSGK